MFLEDIATLAYLYSARVLHHEANALSNKGYTVNDKADYSLCCSPTVASSQLAELHL